MANFGEKTPDYREVSIALYMDVCPILLNHHHHLMFYADCCFHFKFKILLAIRTQISNFEDGCKYAEIYDIACTYRERPLFIIRLYTLRTRTANIAK